MNKSTRKTYFTLVLSCILLCICLLSVAGCSNDSQPASTVPSPTPDIEINENVSNVRPTSLALEINDAWYGGDPILYDSDNDVYFFSIVAISPYLGKELKNSDNGSYYWDDTLIAYSEADPKTIKYEDLLYVSEQYLQENLNLNIVRCLPEIYIDDYPTLDYSWTKYRAIAHSAGGKDKVTYTNSQECLAYNYEQGFRVFEIDFCMTNDGIPVCGHDWENLYAVMALPARDGEDPHPALSYEEFLACRGNGTFTPLTMEELATFMKEHTDVYIVTDTKDTTDPSITEMFQQIIAISNEADPSILDRFIPQIYNNTMGDILWKLYDWKSMIYTFYNQGTEFRYAPIYEYSRKHGIKVFTTYSYRDDMMFITPMTNRGAYLYMHTYNDPDAVMNIISTRKVYGIYTDFLPYDFLDNIPYPYTNENQ